MEGIIAWLDMEYDYGYIAIPNEAFASFFAGYLEGPVRTCQWVDFEPVRYDGYIEAKDIRPRGRMARPDEVHGCPLCGANPIDELREVKHDKRWLRNLVNPLWSSAERAIYSTPSCYECSWVEPRRMVSIQGGRGPSVSPWKPGK